VWFCEADMAILDLVKAIQSFQADDAFRPRFTAEQWRLLGVFLTRYELANGERLIRQGDHDRVMYLIEAGAFQVFSDQRDGQPRRVAILRPGAVVGEPALFSERARMAHAEALMGSVVWALSAPRFDELSQRQPELALELLRATGAVMAVRMQLNLERGVPVS
jgi:CRP/FNR family transcriptional regulator, cyclic AMP receptor protein